MADRRPEPALVHPRDAVVRVIQITDTHLGEVPGTRLLGMDTDESLQAVIDLVRRERPAPDLVLGTGDLSDQGSAASYQRLRHYFESLSAPFFWLPGNHDDLGSMRQIVSHEELVSEIRAGAWQLLLLDSQIPGEVGGEIGRQQLFAVEQALTEARARELFTLVCLHHQPIRVGCDWLDQQRVADAEDLLSLLDRFSGVRGLLWGHVHQQLDLTRSGIQFMCTPSTCIQFRPGQEDFSLDGMPPGYRWLELHPDGRLDTGVSRVADFELGIDLNSRGYL